jgi:RING finger protein 113A
MRGNSKKWYILYGTFSTILSRTGQILRVDNYTVEHSTDASTVIVLDVRLQMVSSSFNMFRKSSKHTKNLRKRSSLSEEDENDNNVKDNDNDNDNDTSNLIREARESFSTSKKKSKPSSSSQNESSSNWMHQYQTSDTSKPSEKDLATGTADHHPEIPKESTLPNDGIFRNTSRNPFLAGPLKATQFVRTTARFDYQPDICKDYKETGFCGYGDTCIYLHDRGDTLSGWQLEQQWEEQKKKEMMQRELDVFSDGRELEKEKEQIPEYGLPFACYLCRDYFQNPVVTSCGHYFSEKCILDHVRKNSDRALCPICNADTHGVFNQPTKLISKKRRLLGATASWQEFMEYQTNNTSTSSSNPN